MRGYMAGSGDEDAWLQGIFDNKKPRYSGVIDFLGAPQNSTVDGARIPGAVVALRTVRHVC